MKGKNLLGGFSMAVLGAVIALFAYTKLIDRPAGTLYNSSSAEISNPPAMLTSYQAQPVAQVDLTYAAEQTVHAVVHVHVMSMTSAEPDNPIMQWFYGDQYSNKPKEVSGYGSGVIISPDGYIITNNHVVENAESVEVKLNDNRVFTAKVVGRDPSTDIALIKIKADNLQYIKYGDSDQLKLGQWVLAVGNPFNLTSTVTAGIVSAKGRSLGINEGDARIESFIQTDAALNPGNSGGALVDTKGLLVGITSAILSPSGAYAGNSFAIPVNIVKKVVADLKQYGEVQRAYIGVQIRPATEDDAKKLDLKKIDGVVIAKVNDNSSAMEAGLKENDVITSINGIAVHTPSELQEQVTQFRPGDKTNITYLRKGVENNVSLVMKNIAGNTNVVTAAMDTQSVFGAKLTPLGSSDKKTYNVNSGLKITEINDGKFKDLGLRKGTIILSINGKDVKNPSDVRDAVNAEGTLKSIEGIQVDGTVFSYQFK